MNYLFSNDHQDPRDVLLVKKLGKDKTLETNISV